MTVKENLNQIEEAKKIKKVIDAINSENEAPEEKIIQNIRQENKLAFLKTLCMISKTNLVKIEK